MINVIIDIGNNDIKYLAESKGCFSSRIHTHFEANEESFNRVEIDGVKTFIGVGELEKEYNKTDRNLTPQILFAIHNATHERDINLCLLLPVNQMKLKERLINRYQNTKFISKINGIDKEININKCIVLPESLCTYYSLTNPSPFQMIIDIGSKTVNWCAYENGKLVMNDTETIGTLDFYNTICTIENAKGSKFKIEDIQNQINRNRITVDIREYKSFLRDIMDRIKAKIDVKNYDVMFAGGGALLLKLVLDAIPSVDIHPDALYSNAIGAANICKVKM